jgi:choline dehydrogenase-like flavoprotein
LPKHYDLILVGSSFASSFFLHEALRHLPSDARVLVLERGLHRSHAWQLEHRGYLRSKSARTFVNANRRKPWRFTVAVGGSSNCWVGCTPRMLPEDFELQSRYGVGADWPITYDELEPFYAEAERIMSVSGPDNSALFPRSDAYPQVPHRMQDTGLAWQKAWPGHVFAMPTARARVPTKRRAACCANHVCQTCPVNAKFTILNEMMHLFDDPRVELIPGARVDALDIEGGRVTGVRYQLSGKDQTARADFVGVGANAMFNPVILEKSGLRHPELGLGLLEQVAIRVDVLLDGMEGFQGSTYLTGHGYQLYSGEHRRVRSAGLIETRNKPELRMERGKWRQILRIKVVLEDLRQARNRVVATDDPKRPAKAEWYAHSEYANRTLAALPEELPKVLRGLPVEDIRIRDRVESSEAHVIGTVPFGRDPTSSVVDADLVHHRVRNLAVLGSSAYPTAPPPNPTLTLSALSLRAGRRVYARSVE